MNSGTIYLDHLVLEQFNILAVYSLKKKKLYIYIYIYIYIYSGCLFLKYIYD